jgi:hypothetical protein
VEYSNAAVSPEIRKLRIVESGSIAFSLGMRKPRGLESGNCGSADILEGRTSTVRKLWKSGHCGCPERYSPSRSIISLEQFPSIPVERISEVRNLRVSPHLVVFVAA